MSNSPPLGHSTLRDSLAGARFVKVAGPAGDWIVFKNAPTTDSVSQDQVIALCDRHSGVGATGLVIMTPNDEEASHPTAAYRLAAWHADGSVVDEMTEPARAATSVLAALGAIDTRGTSHHAFETNTNLVTTVYTPAYIGVDIGQWSFVEPATAAAAGSDTLVMTAGLTDPRPGLSIRLHHNHIMIAVETFHELEAIDLGQVPSIEPEPEHPTTVGFVVPHDPLIDTGVGQLMMRSSGNANDHTLAAATAAASVAFQQWSGLEQLNVWNVETPQGDIVVQLHDHNRISTFAQVSAVYFGSF